MTALCILSAVVLAGLVVPDAQANHGSGWYDRRWALRSGDPFPLGQVDYHVDRRVPGEFRDMILSADLAWDTVDGSNFNYRPGVEVDDLRWRLDPCPLYGDVIVTYADHYPGAWDDEYGQTIHCPTDQGFMHSARVRISDDWRRNENPYNSNDFYFGTGDVPNNTQDVWGVITHEFGHATGRVGGDAHFPAAPDDACDAKDDYSTMCRTPRPGKKEWRTLSTHDESALRLRYPS